MIHSDGLVSVRRFVCCQAQYVRQKLVVQLNNLNGASLAKQSPDSIQLKCNNLSGSPVAGISWFHNGVPFNQTL